MMRDVGRCRGSRVELVLASATNDIPTVGRRSEGLMAYTRREFGKLALASVPAAALYDSPLFAAGLFQGRPNSLMNGVQVGAITYSYRQMPDQSAEATLRYIVESGISAIELMGGPVESFGGAPTGRGGGG